MDSPASQSDLNHDRNEENRLRPYVRLVDGGLRFLALIDFRALCPDHESGVQALRFPQVRKGLV